MSFQLIDTGSNNNSYDGDSLRAGGHKINQNYGLTATTGSNTFIGNQIITGSLFITGSTPQKMEFGVQSSDGSPISVGSKGIKSFPFPGTIIEWKLICSGSSNVSASLWRRNNSFPTQSDNIFTASVLNNTMSFGTVNIPVVAGDVFRFEIISNTSASYIFLGVKII